MKTTIAIPLHASAQWLESIAETIERLVGVAQIIVSDATLVDDTLERLEERFAGVEGITWRRPTGVAPGWVPHCNDLLDAATTDYFMWLPHDDSIEPDWITVAEEALDTYPEVILAAGVVEATDPEGHVWQYGLDERFAHPDALVRARSALWWFWQVNRNVLGLAFRGVMRRETAVPLPDFEVSGTGADLPWALRMLWRGRFAALGTVYSKRFHHDGSASKSWDSPPWDRRTRELWAPWGLQDCNRSVATALLAEAWADEVEFLRRPAPEA